jgi:DNA polymerase III subunit epsilon
MFMLSADLLIHYRQLAQRPMVVVDVETTGRFAWESRITEISVLQASLTEGIQQQQTHLINPQTQIPTRIVQVTGITQDMVDSAPLAADVLPLYLPWLSQDVLTAHNLEFDYNFLKAEYARLGSTFSRVSAEQLCTVELARLMLADLPSRSLPYLVRHFEFNVGRSHRAEADTLACWLLAKRLLTEILDEPDAALLARFAQQWIPLKIAAHLLSCSQIEGRSRLEAAGVLFRSSGGGRGSTLMYRRGAVERLVEEQQTSAQLSLEL